MGASDKTKAVHTGESFGKAWYINPMHPPIWLSNTFGADSPERFAELCYWYGRVSNPNFTVLEKKYAALHDGKYALSFSTGMAAISSLFFSLLGNNTHVIAGQPLYCGTYDLLTRILPKMFKKFRVSFVKETEQSPKFLRGLIRRSTALMYFSSPANPTMPIFDIKLWADIAAKARIPLAVDNTFATPINQKPLDWGASVAVESLTKFSGDDGTRFGGIAVSDDRELTERLHYLRTHLGCTLDAEAAWHIAKSVRTLPTRIAAHNKNTAIIAEYLLSCPKIKRVLYPGNPRSSGYPVAKTQMSGFGSMLAFEINGGHRKLRRFAKRLVKAFGPLCVSLGSSNTIISPVYSSVYKDLPRSETKAMGITTGLFRVSVGLEDPYDLCKQFGNALR